ncbi:TetR family transcriptional regulator [Conexibacter sp. W3-3-2]|nr:TetR family transcriptional regulator [Conexibacter sp. W3-3-2]
MPSPANPDPMMATSVWVGVMLLVLLGTRYGLVATASLHTPDCSDSHTGCPVASRTPRLAPEVRRAQLLDTTLDLITEEGFAAVSVEAVARRAGVTRPVIYDQFGDLDGLMVALLDREEAAALQPLLAIVGEDQGDDVDPEAFLVEAVETFCEAVLAAPRTWRLVVMPPRGRSPELEARVTRSRRIVVERVAALLHWGLVRRGGPLGLDAELLARVVVACGEDGARLMLEQPDRFPPARLAALAREGLQLLPADATPAGAPRPTLPDLGPPRPSAARRPEPDPADPPPAPARRMPQAERRRQLIGVALDLVAAEGFGALTMEEVARRAGVSKVVVYRSFANVGVLLLALLRVAERRTRTTLEGLLPTDPAGRTPAVLLGEALASLLAAAEHDPPLWRLALLRPEQAPKAVQAVIHRRRSALARDLRPLVRWGLQGVGARASGVDVEVLTRLLLSAGEELVREVLEEPRTPADEILEKVWTLLDRLPVGD